MLDPLKSTVIVAAALTLTLLAPAAPAYADCIVVGAVQLDRHDLVDDPTGPVLVVRTSPQDDFHYFVRLRDGSFLRKAAAAPAPLHVLLHGDARYCPAEGSLRDAGTAVGEPRILSLSADTRNAD